MIKFIVIILVIIIELTIQNEFEDFQNNELDEYATPSLLITGVAKGGTTDLWSLLTSVYPDFMCSPTKNIKSNSKSCSLEKEFNSFYVSGSYKDNYKCPAEVLTKLMQCPENIVRNNDFSRNITRCEEWLGSDYGKTSKPKFTIDAYPMLMRDSCCEPKLAAMINWNKENDQCNIKRKKTPKIIVLLRDPYNRTISYYNYFTCRSKTIPLEDMLKLEFDLFSKSPAKEYIDIITHIPSDHQHIDFKYARHIILAYEKLQNYMEKEMITIKRNNTDHNYERYGLLIDSIYLPQFLSLIFPTDQNEQRITIDWPILIIKSEYFFDDRASLLEDNIIPFLHPDLDKRNETKIPPKNEYMQQNGANVLNSKQGHYNNISMLSDEMSIKLSKFYSLTNMNLNYIMHRLSTRDRINLAPPIKNLKVDSWWLHNKK